MGRHTDFYPIEYLEKRVIYYKKLLSKTKNYINDDFFILTYGEDELKELIRKKSESIKNIIKEFENAILILKQNQDESEHEN